MTATTHAVFLSYASQDAEAVQQICDALRAAGLEVWFDQSELRGGEAWDASIRRQVKECALFVPVISANTQARSEGYFRREWNMAAQRTLDMADDQAFLLPVVIDGTPDASARVPEKFREVQWTRLPAGGTPAAFVEHVRQLLPGGVAVSPSAQPHVAPRTHPAAFASGPGVPSIAVLPFVNRSHDEADEYFADGLADELLNVLAKIRGLRVAARSSAFTFKGKGATVAEVGRALNVGTVLEGSVRKSGNRLRISVQLVNVADGYDLWSETYDRTLEDIFAMQDDIAQSVVKELRGALLGGAIDAKVAAEATAQVAAAVKGRSKDPEAHRLYLQARFLIDRHTREDTTKGIGYLEQALDRDPLFALAWAELGRAYTHEAGRGWVPAREGHQRAREAAERALSLESTLAEGYAQRGWLQMVDDWDWRGAEASLRRAQELAPGNSVVLRRAGSLAMNMGRFDDAIGFFHRALEQDPLDSSTYSVLAYALGAADRAAEADAAARKSLELAPQRVITRSWLALNLRAQSRGDEALDQALREPDEMFRLYALAIVHYGARRLSEGDAALHELIAKYAEHGPFQVAEVYAARAEADLAFDWLERAYTLRDGGLSETKSSTLLRTLHADPRWGAFLRKMGLPP